MNRIVAFCIAALCSVPVVASAADLPRKAPPVAYLATPAMNWTGFYVGIHGAYHDGKINDTGCVGLCIVGHKIREPYAAIVGGADYQFSNNVVLGVMSWVGITPVRSSAVLAPGITINGKTNYAAFIGGRVGYAIGNFLPYAFVGAEFSETRVNIAAAAIPTNTRAHTGYGTGFGLEYALTRNWSIDGRYMYSDLGRETYNFGGGAVRAGETAHTVSFGVNYRFGGPVVAKY